MLPHNATPADIDQLAELGAAFHASVKPEWPWSEGCFRDTLSTLLQIGHVTISANGFMAGYSAAHPLTPDWIVAHEALWFAPDGDGPAHFRAFRKWAKDIGANEIKWSCRADNARVSRFYSRFARPTEVAYSEAMPCALAKS